MDLKNNGLTLSNLVYSHNLSSLKRVEFIHNHKLNDLKREYLDGNINPDKVIFNFSSYVLSDIEKNVLSWGFAFSFLV